MHWCAKLKQQTAIFHIYRNTEMESPFQGPGGGQAHLPHQTSYPSSQGLIMPPNTTMMPAEIPEGQTEMETTPGMNPTGLANPQQKDISISMICRMGQETVADIISKCADLFTVLKTLQPPNGTAASINAQEERKAKVQELLRTITFCFTKLRRICERCNYSSATMEYTHIEVDSLVPLKDEVDSRQDDRKPADAVRTSSAEYNHLKERTFMRNKHLKEIIDNLRSFIWDINTMLAMRKP
ncbi:mediator of RNA polymerase II transcription subunit 30 [Caerostris extrusa]|uniref:Mediator of RNA polymerase II transcription subunit 30 n=1 Tax=Caerostris extrusa TaxID=172846 RepID=A0AAV4VID2_CAEEX|nr:mediator of RNA polymerase II transcription subunit 30 [Caerostris extrusa]